MSINFLFTQWGLYALITIFYATPRLWLLLEDFLQGGFERAILNGPRRFAKDCFAAVAAVLAAYWSIMDIGSMWIAYDGVPIIDMREAYPTIVAILVLGYFWALIWLWRLGIFIWAFMLGPFLAGLRGRDA